MSRKGAKPPIGYENKIIIICTEEQEEHIRECGCIACDDDICDCACCCRCAYDADKIEYRRHLQLYADNSTVDLESEKDTDNYIEIFGEEELESMDVTEELQ